MENKHLNLNDKNMTPSTKKTVIDKALSNTISCDSPYKCLPNFSTPPSRFSRIFNPFESPLMERLHLPVCSPSVFSKSTPKKEDKFKWSICDISSLRPAEIDESSVDQHVTTYDPIRESLVQEKISMFFSEKSIVPSPLNADESNRIAPPIIKSPQAETPPGSSKSAIASELGDSPLENVNPNEEIFDNLFNYDEHSMSKSVESSPAPSTGLSPLQLSPLEEPTAYMDKSFGDDNLCLDIRECSLSPIDTGRESGTGRVSACKLNFNKDMEIDSGELLVPDVNDLPSINGTLDESAFLSTHEALGVSEVNWDMEYNHVSLAFDNSADKMDISNLTTPTSRLRSTSQRKRLSESFKLEMEPDEGSDNDVLSNANNRRAKSRLFSDNLTDTGYQTGANTFNESLLFASTPTKCRTD